MVKGQEIYCCQNRQCFLKGLLALRSGYDKKSQQAKADSKKKTNVPSWSNPDYDNQTSQADQAKLDEIRRRALAKLEKGKE